MLSDGVGEQFNVLVVTSLLLHIQSGSFQICWKRALHTTLYLQQQVFLQQTLAVLLLHSF